MSSLLADLLHDGLRLVVVVHVSQENNTAERARSLAQGALKSHSAALFVSEQDRPTPLFDLEAEQVSAPLAS